MKSGNQLRHATAVIRAYRGEMPLHSWLKNFFRENRQMGARDRKLLSTLVYGYYRLGHAIRDLHIEERVLAGLFLCHGEPHELLQHFHPDWNEKATLPLEERIAFFQTQSCGAEFRVTDIFPWKDELSAGIDHHAFCLSFLRQPQLFLRIRPGHEKAVRQKLDAGVSLPNSTAPPPSGAGALGGAAPYEFIPPFTLRLPNGFKVEDYFTPDHEVVIQDYSSQQIASFFPLPSPYLRAPEPSAEAPHSYWDVCAGSGGKSILAHDCYPEMTITATDIRESILRNLRKRFRQAGIKKYQAFVKDLTQALPDPQTSRAPQISRPPQTPRPPQTSRPPVFDLILADVPCTGSGTWSRTPEELFLFDPNKILHYSEIQKKILTNTIPALAAEAWLIYSTCSVFRKENEEIAVYLREKFGLKENRMENIKGYDQQADTMFAARFRR